MAGVTLRRHTFTNAQTGVSSNTNWFPIDWRPTQAPVEDRIVQGIVSGSVGNATLQATIGVPSSALDSSVDIVNVTAFSGNFFHEFTTKATHIRFAIASSNGTWNIKGLV